MTSKMESTEKWPNFFIVGATKAGTTSLHAYLNDIPGIYMSPVKEPKYFLASDSPKPISSLKVVFILPLRICIK